MPITGTELLYALCAALSRFFYVPSHIDRFAQTKLACGACPHTFGGILHRYTITINRTKAPLTADKPQYIMKSKLGGGMPLVTCRQEANLYAEDGLCINRCAALLLGQWFCWAGANRLRRYRRAKNPAIPLWDTGLKAQCTSMLSATATPHGPLRHLRSRTAEDGASTAAG